MGKSVVRKDETDFELLQREAKALSQSSLVPDAFRGNIPNCMIAISKAKKLSHLGISAYDVAQNLFIIYGKSGYSASFYISLINSCGRYSPLEYKWNKDKTACVAYATNLKTGKVVEGPQVDMKMAHAEGWVDKKGSKWRTMPQLMLMYRAAAFFGRVYVPDVINGAHMVDELKDIAPDQRQRDVTPPKDDEDMIDQVFGSAPDIHDMPDPVEPVEVDIVDEDSEIGDMF